MLLMFLSQDLRKLTGTGFISLLHRGMQEEDQSVVVEFM
jgi:hypothetical protein